jgi:ankyrin repeat protein
VLIKHVSRHFWLLAMGANVDERDVNGMTALHFAAIAGQAESMRVLVQHGADRMRRMLLERRRCTLRQCMQWWAGVVGR